MARYSVAPLVAVGFEGLFGAITIAIFMPVMSMWASRSMFFDLPRGWHQMIDNPTVLYSVIITFSQLGPSKQDLGSDHCVLHCFFQLLWPQRH